ncbi:MAG: hypothetical protein ACI8Y7_000233 [Candidatus Woesearchaeota archaeon]|jgi:hypothetical protein
MGLGELSHDDNLDDERTYWLEYVTTNSAESVVYASNADRNAAEEKADQLVLTRMETIRDVFLSDYEGVLSHQRVNAGLMSMIEACVRIREEFLPLWSEYIYDPTNDDKLKAAKKEHKIKVNSFLGNLETNPGEFDTNFYELMIAPNSPMLNALCAINPDLMSDEGQKWYRAVNGCTSSSSDHDLLKQRPHYETGDLETRSRSERILKLSLVEAMVEPLTHIIHIKIAYLKEGPDCRFLYVEKFPTRPQHLTMLYAASVAHITTKYKAISSFSDRK